MVDRSIRMDERTDRLVTDLAYFLRSSKKSILHDAVAEFAETHHPRLLGARDVGQNGGSRGGVDQRHSVSELDEFAERIVSAARGESSREEPPREEPPREGTPPRGDVVRPDGGPTGATRARRSDGVMCTGEDSDSEGRRGRDGIESGEGARSEGIASGGGVASGDGIASAGGVASGDGIASAGGVASGGAVASGGGVVERGGSGGGDALAETRERGVTFEALDPLDRLALRRRELVRQFAERGGTNVRLLEPTVEPGASAGSSTRIVLLAETDPVDGSAAVPALEEIARRVLGVHATVVSLTALRLFGSGRDERALAQSRPL